MSLLKQKWNCLSTFHFLICAAYSIHKSVLNLPYDLTNENADAKEDLQQLEYGNKIAILGKNVLLIVKVLSKELFM